MKRTIVLMALLGHLFSSPHLYAGDETDQGWGSWLSSGAKIGLTFVSTLFFADGASGKPIPQEILHPKKPNATKAFMERQAKNVSNESVKRQACDSCCSPCSSCDSCCGGTPSCDSCCPHTSCNSCCGPSYYYQYTQCSTDLNSVRTQLSSTQSQLIDCNFDLQNARYQLASVGQMCTDVKGCYAEIQNPATITTALEEILNRTVTEEEANAVVEYITKGFTSSHCQAAKDLCQAGTCPLPRSCPSRSASTVNGPQLAASALVLTTIYLNNADLVDDTISSGIELIKCRANQLRQYLSQVAYPTQAELEDAVNEEMTY